MDVLTLPERLRRIAKTTRKGKRQATCAPSVLDEAADAIDALLAAQRVPVWPMPSAMPPFERAVGKQAMGDE